MSLEKFNSQPEYKLFLMVKKDPEVVFPIDVSPIDKSVIFLMSPEDQDKITAYEVEKVQKWIGDNVGMLQFLIGGMDSWKMLSDGDAGGIINGLGILDKKNTEDINIGITFSLPQKRENIIQLVN